MSHHLRRIIITFIVIAALITSFGLALNFVLNTQTGARWAVNTANKFIPGKISYTKLRGTLIGPLSIEQLNYQSKDIKISATRLHFDWSPETLLQGRLTIKSLYANDIRIHTAQQKPGQKKSSAKRELSLPFKVNVDDLLLKNIRWYQGSNKEPAIIKQIKLHAQANKQQLSLNLELDANAAHINIQGGHQKQWNLNWQITIPKLSSLIPDLSGNFDSNGKITGPTYKPTVKASISANGVKYSDYSAKSIHSQLRLAINQKSQSSIQIKTTGLKETSHEFANLNLRGTGYISAKKGNIKLSNFCFAQNSNRLCINGQWAPKSASTLQLQWVINNFNKIATFIPEVGQLEGRLKGQLTVKDLTTKPEINGNFSLTNGKASIPALELSLSPITLSGKITQSNVKYTGKLKSGSGTLNIQGLTQLDNFEHSSLVKISGENVLVSNLPEYKITASPDLTLKIQNTDLTLTGKILIPKANIEPQDFTNVVTMPDDVVYVDQPKQKSDDTDFTLTSHIKLQLGDQININVKGVSGQLTGQLQIDETPEQPIIATGQLNLVNGKYDAYGQSLDITTSELNYHGSPINNPNINLRASRTIKQAPSSTFTIDSSNIVVGISATGRLKKPKISLFSSPSGLSQADILSYLIIGQPASQASGSKAQILLVAAQALTAGESPGPIANLTNQVKNSLGLSELSIESVPTANGDTTDNGPLQNTSLVLGKYLSPKLYVNYSIGLLDPVSTVRIRYSLSKNWAVQTESNTLGNGVDILYSFER